MDDLEKKTLESHLKLRDGIIEYWKDRYEKATKREAALVEFLEDLFQTCHELDLSSIEARIFQALKQHKGEQDAK